MEKRWYFMMIFLIIILFFGVYFVFAQARVGLNIGQFQINFTKPLNTTYYYNFNSSKVFNMTLNVSSNRNVTVWRYTVINNGLVVNNSILFNPPTIVYLKKGSNSIIVSAIDDYLNSFNATMNLYVNVTNRAPIIDGLDQIIYVCEGKNLPDYGVPKSFFNITDPEAEVLTNYLNPTYPFFYYPVSTINSTTSSYEIFSAPLEKSDAGGVGQGSQEYPETFSTEDSENAATKSFSIIVMEVNSPPNITSIGAKTLWTVGQYSTFNYTVLANDVEDLDQASGKLYFNISFGNKPKLFDVGTRGEINYKANITSNGTYNVTICVRDSGLAQSNPNLYKCHENGNPKSACTNFSLVITSQNRAPNITRYYPQSLNLIYNSTEDINISITTSDPDGGYPSVYWYVDNVLKRSVTGYDIGYDQNFSYNFGCGIGGNHNITTVVSDGLLSVNLTWNITLNLFSCPDLTPTKPSGGGGSGSTPCIEKWGCKDWGNCINLKDAQRSTIFGFGPKIKERCTGFNWLDDSCGYQLRVCKDVNKCGTNSSQPGLVRECFYSINPTCFDNIKNCHNESCEVLTDCGGPCKPCPSCSDSIRNQGETGVDCGGPCEECNKETPREYFDYMTIVIPALFVVLTLFIIIVIILVWSYIKKRKQYQRINRPKKGF